MQNYSNFTKQELAQESLAVEDTSNNIRIDTTRNLYIYYPQYKNFDLVVASMPKTTDSTVLFCCCASFTGQLL